MLIEYWDSSNPNNTFMPTYLGARVENGVDSALFVQYVTGEEEYYDLKKDPYQLDSAVETNAQAAARLRDRVKTLSACSGAACR